MDKRTRKMNESVEGIKVLKFNTWETVVLKTLSILRKPEMSILRELNVYRGIMITLGLIVTGLAILISFPIYNAVISNLTVAKSYSIITILK